jgi:hypothetical protein
MTDDSMRYEYAPAARQADVVFFCPPIRSSLPQHASDDRAIVPGRLTDDPTPGELAYGATRITAHAPFTVAPGSDLHHLVAKSPHRDRFRRLR